MPNYDQDICRNCDRWRDEHYDPRDGSWAEEKNAKAKCVEYVGRQPTDAERKKHKAE